MGLFLILVILGAGFTLFVVLQPDDLRVTRKSAMYAPASTVFVQVNDLYNWNAWSPWAKLDPNAKITIDGPIASAGAAMSWQSNNPKVGTGSLTITKSQPYELVQFKLVFTKPFEGTQTAEFTFTPDGNKTLVTWSVHGPQNFFCKAMNLIFSSDKMIGSQFEKGLSAMKSIVESSKK